MAGKYAPLTRALTAAADRGQTSIEMSFDDVAELVGGLPASADIRQWWANSSLSQALAWRAAGWHVEQVYLDRRRVRFARGARGGSRHDRGRVAGQRRAAPTPSSRRERTGESVDVRVRLHWYRAGPVALDSGGKVVFGQLEAVPGVYRLTLLSGVTGGRPRVYIGETQDLRRRLAVNYRSPGPTQHTNVRVGALLVNHLRSGGEVRLSVAPEAVIGLPDGTEQPLDLSRSAARLLAENAALVAAQLRDDADIVNLE